MDQEETSQRSHVSSPETFNDPVAHHITRFESGNGNKHRNFELFRSNGTAGITQVWRGGDGPLTWASGGLLASGSAPRGQPAAMGSSFNRDFQIVYTTKNGQLDHWYYSETRPGWFHTGPYWLSDSLAGFPGLTQLDNSAFSVVARTSAGGLKEVCLCQSYSR